MILNRSLIEVYPTLNRSLPVAVPVENVTPKPNQQQLMSMSDKI